MRITQCDACKVQKAGEVPDADIVVSVPTFYRRYEMGSNCVVKMFEAVGSKITLKPSTTKPHIETSGLLRDDL